MKKILTGAIACVTIVGASAQYKMRAVNDLINTANPGWPIVKQWIDTAKNKVEVLPADPTKARDALYKTQVTTRSVMGAIVFNTGGLLVDNGWIRILGSGSAVMQRTLPDWNKGKGFKEFGDTPDFFLVGDDAAGGYFAINYGPFGKDTENVYYLSPDNLQWEPLDMNYEDFIRFCFNSDLNKFYEGIRWSSWLKDLRRLKADEVFHMMPPLWSKEGKDVEKNSKTPIAADEEFLYDIELRKKIGLSQ
jgi:Protein of unknown function DUF2625